MLKAGMYKWWENIEDAEIDCGCKSKMKMLYN